MELDSTYSTPNRYLQPSSLDDSLSKLFRSELCEQLAAVGIGTIREFISWAGAVYMEDSYLFAQIEDEYIRAAIEYLETGPYHFLFSLAQRAELANDYSTQAEDSLERMWQRLPEFSREQLQKMNCTTLYEFQTALLNAKDMCLSANPGVSLRGRWLVFRLLNIVGPLAERF